MLSSISQGTVKQYSSYLKLWWEFCNTNEIDKFHLSIKWTLKFLTQLFDKGASYGTLNCARSALALVILSELGTNLEIQRFFEGIQGLRPNKPRYNYTWDPTTVLEYLKNLYPNDTLSLEKLTCKLVTLLALITAHRMQTFSLINLENIHKRETGFLIFINDRIKTSGKNKSQPVLQIPFFLKDPRVCTAGTLDAYLQKTGTLRQSYNRLILTFKKPYKPASAQSISRWVKKTLKQSGINTDIFSAHSVRNSATSAARRKGVSLDLIKITAGWSQKSATFARFYNRTVVNDNEFAFSILER